MVQSNRRSFLQKAAGFMLLGRPLVSGFHRGYKPNLSFTTLGCPDWPLEKIIRFAKEYGYTGLELRGIQREMDLTKCPELSDAAKREQTLEMMRDAGIRFINLGSSATMHFPQGKARDSNLDEGKRFIELASRLSCPFVRVFPNNFPKDQQKQETLDLIKSGLIILGDYAKGSGVRVLMETHGDLVWKEDLRQVMEDIRHPHTGLIWDPCNMWTITKEQPSAVYKDLKEYIHHIHVKDARLVNGQPQYCFLGEGVVPIFEAVDLLAADNYSGSFSFEWEKLWHPELAEPEVAFPDYPNKMLAHFSIK